MSDENFITKIINNVERFPDKTAFRFIEDSADKFHDWTYQEFLGYVMGFAKRCRDNFLCKQTVILIYTSQESFLKSFFGSLAASVIPVPFLIHNFVKSKQRLKQIIEITNAQAIIADNKFMQYNASAIEEFAKKCRLNWLNSDEVGIEQKVQVSHARLSDLAFVQFTSGSTSAPKGVKISHGNMYAVCEQARKRLSIDSESIFGGWLPFYHDMGLFAMVCFPLSMGCESNLIPTQVFSQNPLLWLEVISNFKVNFSGSPNFAYQICVDKFNSLSTDRVETFKIDLASWYLTANGAEPINYTTMNNFYNTFKKYNFRLEAFACGYGMAEATLVLAMGNKNSSPNYDQLDKLCFEKNILKRTIDSENSKTLVSCGLPLDATDIRIVDPNSLTELAADRIGEIWAQGPQVSQGYFKNPTDTKVVFDFKIQGNQDAGNYYRTGDLGYISSVNHELFVTGRIKDLIIIRGKNYYPQDVEFFIESCMPELIKGSSAAFSIEQDFQEKLILVLAIKSQYMQDLSTLELRTKIKENIINQFQIDVHDIVFILPKTVKKTTSGKIARQKIKKAYLENQLHIMSENKDEDFIDDQIEQCLLKEIQKNVGSSLNINLKNSIFMYGYDSIKMLELAQNLAQTYRKEFPIEVFFKHNSIKDLLTDLRAIIGGKAADLLFSADDPAADIAWINQLSFPKIDEVKPPAYILITGATGFVGVHVLKEMLTKTNAKVLCLSRAETDAAAMQRIFKNFEKWEIALSDKDRSRISAMAADISKLKFGLNEGVYAFLTQVIDTVVHCAAVDNFYVPYSVIRGSNVVGTQNIIMFSMSNRAKVLHYTSSCGVDVIDPKNLKNNSVGLKNGYSKSKYICHHYLNVMIENGYPAYAYKLGYLYTDRDFAETESFENILSIGIVLGLLPRLDADFDYTHIDYVASAMVDHIANPESKGKLLTYYNPSKTRFSDLYQALQKKWPDLKIVSIQQFKNALEEEILRKNKYGILKQYIPLITEEVEMEINLMFKNKKIDINRNFINTCPEIDGSFYLDLIHDMERYIKSRFSMCQKLKVEEII